MYQLSIQILRSKNKLMVIQAVLIGLALSLNFMAKDSPFSHIGLLVAGLIGTLPILIQAISSLKIKLVTIDVLVAIAAIGALMIQNYEETAIVTFLFLFGAWLEGKTLDYTRSSIKSLTEMAPDLAWVQQEDGEFAEEDIDFVEEGDIVLVKTGGKVPVDGKIIQGQGSVNEASITGESVLLSKSVGDSVFAGTILENGTIQIETDKVGEETTFGRIIELVEEAQDSRSSTERFINRFAKWYTPLVLLIGLIVGMITQDVEVAITILVLGCPWALVIGIPVSNVAGIGNGAKNGVLLKGSEVIQNFAKVDTMIFDKTGTLTMGKTRVNQEYRYGNFQSHHLDYLLAVEKESDHPLALAILNYYGSLASNAKVEHTDVIKGQGIEAIVEKHKVLIGKLDLMERNFLKITNQVINEIEALEKSGHSIVVMAVNQEIVLVLGIKDQIRPGIKPYLELLKKSGVKNLVLASGDNQQTVDLVAKELALDLAMGNLLPQDKANYLVEQQEKGHTVAFIGDGVNDSPSIAKADVGIAMGSGTDVAIESSDVVLVQSDFKHLVHAYLLSKKTNLNMMENIVIALTVVILLIGFLLFSPWMSMSLGMLIHEGSILLVIINALRLLAFKIKKE
ncbi:heavy metal translocating P-type ATPase [Facklamia sp. 7083-14-GEN3]|uniref:heavy metal translocating P-type ATPase n=1 Tax=Facklamia sp. 7083-14-GEN3 TaxID=2973478 RepID=UPI00215C4F32|nr:heavy metal translocating P-type ATPase [Facklamia sp. 7083-14-GEN3]MCR8968899.1 heavy metal translocating P-type ATPase [Facklamia sp. 7083-14-GEN3]